MSEPYSAYYPASGASIYFVTQTADRSQSWSMPGSGSPGFEAKNPSHWSSYALAATDDGTRNYQASVPSGIAAGTGIFVAAYLQSGGSPAISDALIAQGEFLWSGSALLPPGVSVAAVGGVAIPTPSVPGVLTVSADYCQGVPIHPEDGTASAVTSSTITLQSSDPHFGINNANSTIEILSATAGAGQAAIINTSNTSTGVQTLTSAGWSSGITPTGTVTYKITPQTTAAITTPVTVGTNNDKAGYALSSAGLDGIQVESGVNARQALSPILAASAGVVSGAGTGVIVIKGGSTSTTRITATTDNAGNRSSVNLTLPT